VRSQNTVSEAALYKLVIRSKIVVLEQGQQLLVKLYNDQHGSSPIGGVGLNDCLLEGASMATKEIDILELQNDLEAIVDGLAPGESIIVTKEGRPHARLEPIRLRFGSLAKYAVPDSGMHYMNPEIEAMFEGREFTLLPDPAEKNASSTRLPFQGSGLPNLPLNLADYEGHDKDDYYADLFEGKDTRKPSEH
jgi:antitoxin (DNA-binding transcriptional repressor) of toxin-antitoxin stability system